MHTSTQRLTITCAVATSQQRRVGMQANAPHMTGLPGTCWGCRATSLPGWLLSPPWNTARCPGSYSLRCWSSGSSAWVSEGVRKLQCGGVTRSKGEALLSVAAQHQSHLPACDGQAVVRAACWWMRRERNWSCSDSAGVMTHSSV